MVIRIEGREVTAAVGDDRSDLTQFAVLRLTGGELVKDDNAYRVSWDDAREFLAFADVVASWAQSVRDQLEGGD